MSLSERFQQAKSATDPAQKIQLLLDLVPTTLRPSSNESLEDVSTAQLQYLVADHWLAVAYTELPGLSERLSHLQSALNYWSRFLETLDRLDLLSKPEQAQFQALQETNNDTDNSTTTDKELLNTVLAPVDRATKIAQFHTLQAAQNEQARLESLQARRGRLQMAETEALDGHDAESLERAWALAVVQVYKAQALEGWKDVLRELPLLKMRMQQQEQQQDDRYGTQQQREADQAAAQQPNRPGLQVTRVTQDPTTGQLHLQREQVRANVLRPGWNQPTMSLEELAQREVAQAMQREAAQKVSEEQAQHQPRRYDQLRKDGQEDDADLVDASAVLDRKWDDFRDANPRGSGNKRGDVGDRNF